MGGINAIPFSFCVGTFLGTDVDVAMWEFMMKTDGFRGGGARAAYEARM